MRKQILIPIVIMMCVVPLLVLLKIVPIPETILPFWIENNMNYDYFSFYKSRVLILCAALLLILLLFQWRNKSNRKKGRIKYILLIVAFFILVFLSGVFAEYRSIAFWGAPDRYEGTLVWLSYFVLLIASSYFLDFKGCKWIVIALLASASVISIIGIFQYYGMDIYGSNWGQSLIASKDFLSSYTINSENGIHRLTSTLYNSNNTGMYFAMLFPFVLTLFLTAGSIKKHVVTGGLSCLFFATLLGSNARGAFLAVVVALLVLLIISRRLIRESQTPALLLVLCLLLVAVTMDWTSGGSVFQRIDSISDAVSISSSEGIWCPQASEGKTLAGIYNDKIAMKFDNNKVTINVGKQKLVIETGTGKLRFADAWGHTLQMASADGGETWFIDDGRFEAIQFVLKENRLALSVEDITVPLIIYNGVLMFNGEVTATIKGVTDHHSYLLIDNGDEPISVRVQTGRVACSSTDGRELSLVSVGAKQYRVNDSRFIDYRFEYDGGKLLLYKGNKYLQFAVDDTGFKQQNHLGKTFEIGQLIESCGFSGKESFFSNRGYIWSRSIPLLKDTILLGHGADTFLAYFPQEDLLGKFLFLGGQNMVVDKPHNLYLQMGINSGLVSVLLLLVFLWIYLFTSFKKYAGLMVATPFSSVGIACMVAVIGYLGSGLVYDSNVSVSPVFWGLLGLGMACNKGYDEELRNGEED